MFSKSNPRSIFRRFPKGGLFEKHFAVPHAEIMCFSETFERFTGQKPLKSVAETLREFGYKTKRFISKSQGRFLELVEKLGSVGEVLPRLDYRIVLICPNVPEINLEIPRATLQNLPRAKIPLPEELFRVKNGNPPVYVDPVTAKEKWALESRLRKEEAVKRGIDVYTPGHQPLPKSPYRCKSTVHSTGQRCKHYAIRNTGACRLHSKTYKVPVNCSRLRSVVTTYGTDDIPGLKHMPLSYRKYLSGAVKDRFSDALGQNDAEALELWEELALSRVMMVDAVQVYDACSQISDPQQQLSARLAAAETMRTASDGVKTLVESIIKNKSRIDGALIEFKLAAATSAIIAQIVTLAHEVFDGDPRIEQLTTQLRTNIVVPDVTTGTDLTPAMAAQGMIESVPYVNDDPAAEEYIEVEGTTVEEALGI